MTQKEKELYKTFFEKEVEVLLSIINGTDYTEEAIKIAHKVIEDKGGIDKINKEIKYNSNKTEEKKRILSEINQNLTSQPIEELWGIIIDINSDFYSKEELDEFVSFEKSKITEDYESKKLTAKRLGAIVIGVILASIISSVILYLILSQDKTRIPVILFLPIIGVNYLIIRIISGIKKLNLASFISNLMAFIFSVLLLKGFIWLYLMYSLNQ